MKNAVAGCDAAILRLPSTVAQRLSKSVIRSGIPYACEVVFNAKDGYDSSSSLTEKLLWRIIDRKMKKICRGADGVSCVTQFQLQKRYYSLKPGHFESHYSSLELKEDFYTDARSYPQKDNLTIAHVSNQIKLFGRKGEAALIEAVGLLKKQGIKVFLKFAGDDWDNSSKDIYDYALKHDIREQVECVGYLSRIQLERFLEEADLFVLPTKAEGLPRVIIEAMAKGLPVITTPVSGNPELVSNGFLVGYDDVPSLADRIKLLVTHTYAYEDASRENFARSTDFVADTLEKRRDAFYTELKKMAVSHKTIN